MAYTTIDKPTDYFNTVLYAGDNTTSNAITGLGHQPDWLWIRNRGATADFQTADSVRGKSGSLFLQLRTNTTDTEVVQSDNDGVHSFDSDGFTVGYTNSTAWNNTGNNYVAWSWKAGGSASSNSNGDITTSISANTTAGFSIVSYTGNASSSQTVGHGLGAVPHMIISKNRDNTSSNYNDWIVYHHKNATANDKKLKLNTNDAVSTTNEWGDTDPTSTVYSVHSSGDGATNDGTDKIVSYVFTGIQGYSKFGTYEGNGNANGTFVYTGFRPDWVMVKSTSGSQSWTIIDNVREPYNEMGEKCLFPNEDTAEFDPANINFDCLSNGFKLRNTDGKINTSGHNYIFAAFAEAPFVNSNGIPNNAR